MQIYLFPLGVIILMIAVASFFVNEERRRQSIGIALVGVALMLLASSQAPQVMAVLIQL